MTEYANFKVDRNTNFERYYEGNLNPHDIVYLPMPNVNANQRSVNDIGWQCDGDIRIYATLSHKLTDNDKETLWSEVGTEQEINKTVQFLKIEGGETGGRVYVRVNIN